jgi:hypothetical protein
MHDAGAGDARDRRCVMQQRIGERAVPVSAAGMDHQARRLVDDDQRRVFVDDGERDRLRRERCGTRIGQRRDDDAFAASQPALGVDRGAGERDAPAIDPGANSAARMLGHELRQRLVEPHPGAVRGDDDDDARARRIAGRRWVIICRYQWSIQ